MRIQNQCMPNVHILINLTSPFPILGLLGGIFHFYSNLKKTQQHLYANGGEPDQTLRFALFDDVSQKGRYAYMA